MHSFIQNLLGHVALDHSWNETRVQLCSPKIEGISQNLD